MRWLVHSLIDKGARSRGVPLHHETLSEGVIQTSTVSSVEKLVETILLGTGLLLLLYEKI